MKIVKLTGVSRKGKNRLKETGTDLWEVRVVDWLSSVPEDKLFLVPTVGSVAEREKHSRWILRVNDPDFRWTLVDNIADHL